MKPISECGNWSIEEIREQIRERKSEIEKLRGQNALTVDKCLTPYNIADTANAPTWIQIGTLVWGSLAYAGAQLDESRINTLVEALEKEIESLSTLKREKLDEQAQRLAELEAREAQRNSRSGLFGAVSSYLWPTDRDSKNEEEKPGPQPII